MTKQDTYLGGTIIVYRGSYCMISPGFHLSHAGPGGRMLLRREVSWRNINGFIWNGHKSCRWFLFRRRIA